MTCFACAASAPPVCWQEVEKVGDMRARVDADVPRHGVGVEARVGHVEKEDGVLRCAHRGTPSADGSATACQSVCTNPASGWSARW